jgi:hypothetical protein
MVERIRQRVSYAGPGATLARSIGVAALVVLGTAACSSNAPKTEVQGAVVTSDDSNLGGPNAAVSEFRAGERSVYGN